MNAKVPQNYLMIQGVYLDGTPGVEMVAGGFDHYQLGDEFDRLRIHPDSGPYVVLGDNPKRYHKDEVEPWVVIKVFTPEDQDLLRQIERVHGGTAIENLFASNVAMKMTRVYVHAAP